MRAHLNGRVMSVVALLHGMYMITRHSGRCAMGFHLRLRMRMHSSAQHLSGRGRAHQSARAMIICVPHICEEHCEFIAHTRAHG